MGLRIITLLIMWLIAIYVGLNTELHDHNGDLIIPFPWIRRMIEAIFLAVILHAARAEFIRMFGGSDGR